MPEEYLLTALKATIYDIIRRQPFSRHVSNKFAVPDGKTYYFKTVE
jgi:hypothetical protein